MLGIGWSSPWVRTTAEVGIELARKKEKRKKKSRFSGKGVESTSPGVRVIKSEKTCNQQESVGRKEQLWRNRGDRRLEVTETISRREDSWAHSGMVMWSKAEHHNKA